MAILMSRNLANLIIDSLKSNNSSKASAQPAAAGEGSPTELNLFGDREFLTAESASEVLAPLLAPGSAIAKARAPSELHGGVIACMHDHSWPGVRRASASMQCAGVLQSRKRQMFRLGVQIKLSTKSFGREAAEVAATAIANVASSLAHADLSDVIAGRPEVLICPLSVAQAALPNVHHSLSREAPDAGGCILCY
jgi:large subunit ribosomal protein L31/Ran GTPase-activating protein 1